MVGWKHYHQNAYSHDLHLHLDVDGKTVHIESMSRSRMYVHYKARRKYPNARYIRIINQTKTY